MTRIVTSTYRYKRPPKKRKPNPAALAMPKIVHAKTPKPGTVPARVQAKQEQAAPAYDDRKSDIAGKSSRHRDPNGQMAAEVNLSIFPSEAQAQSRRVKRPLTQPKTRTCPRKSAGRPSSPFAAASTHGSATPPR